MPNEMEIMGPCPASSKRISLISMDISSIFRLTSGAIEDIHHIKEQSSSKIRTYGVQDVIQKTQS